MQKHWSNWRRKKTEDKQTRNNGTNQRSNEQSQKEGKIRRVQCRDGTPTHHQSDGSKDRFGDGVHHQRPGLNQQRYGSEESLMMDGLHHHQQPGPRQQSWKSPSAGHPQQSYRTKQQNHFNGLHYQRQESRHAQQSPGGSSKKRLMSGGLQHQHAEPKQQSRSRESLTSQHPQQSYRPKQQNNFTKERLMSSGLHQSESRYAQQSPGGSSKKRLMSGGLQHQHAEPMQQSRSRESLTSQHSQQNLFPKERLMPGGLQHQHAGPKQQSRSGESSSGSHRPQQGYKPTQESRGQCNEIQGTSSHSTTASSKVEIHIPGFYFDPVKKRYFRHFPGLPNNFNPYSKEALQQKEAEKTRLDLLNNLSSKSACPSISKILLQRQRGKLLSSSYERQCHEACVARMSLKASQQILTCPDTAYHGASGYMNLLQADKDRKKILTIISDERFHRFWQGSVTAVRHESTQIDVKNWRNINCVGARCSKVTSASWVSVDGQQDNHVLYTVFGGQSSEIQLFEQNPDSLHILYNQSAYGMIWASTWSNNKMLPNHLGVGGKKSYVVDIMTSVKTNLNTNGSEVFCQVFAKSQPLLYNGTKRGEVFNFDLRTPSQYRRKFASIMHHSTSVCCLQLLNDENYIIASDISGKIKMWDIRMCAVAREYNGNNNQLKHLPFKVDSTESILYTVGQDCFTRLWSIKTGDLLKTIPPPLPASKQTLPSAVYSTDWAGSSGLLLATHKQLDWYPL